LVAGGAESSFIFRAQESLGIKKKSSFSSVIFCEEEREKTFRELMHREKIEEMNRKAGVYINI
jgi:hypothetical protein